FGRNDPSNHQRPAVQQLALNGPVERALEWISSKTNRKWRVRARERLRRPFDELCKVIKERRLDLIFGGCGLRCGNRAIDDDRTDTPHRSQSEALRLVPGVQVARINASSWAISARGFNTQVSNKMLVQIDGRTVYSPIFGGVFWELQDLVLDDIARIEVVRGPGATLWGTNAVNGIVNIVTKSAHQTKSTTIILSGGGADDLG